ncbi:MAG TPA: ribosomal protein S18-alanine N-acetyltransferase [Bryobacteraceae bacterium]|nr:ribosomal protein S18-alanine N-acetyltransferase [Bryobacteraceae bacterium]
MLRTLMNTVAQIRMFRRADMRSLLDIERAAFPEEAYPKSLFEELFKKCGDLFLVAERRQRILGYMITCVTARKAEIVSIAVHPNKQRLGIGRALMKSTLQELEGRQVRTLELTVRDANKGALRFYRRFGFRRIRTVTRYYEDGSDGVQMRKQLAAYH